MGRASKITLAALAVMSLLICIVTVSFVSAGSKQAANEVTQYVIDTKTAYKHSLSAYTQGLFFHNGSLYESTGQYGESTFRRVDLNTGKVEKSISFPKQYFGEGSCVFDGVVYVLTWQEEICFVYDIVTFEKVAEFRYRGEGWGLTTDGKSLIMSNGTATLSFRDPYTFIEQKSIEVKMGGRPVHFLNELEYINGDIWANVYGLDRILIIDSETGNVKGRIDCAGLLEPQYKTRNIDVLNGIAYNPADGSVYLTGKFWPVIYKVTLKETK